MFPTSSTINEISSSVFTLLLLLLLTAKKLTCTHRTYGALKETCVCVWVGVGRKEIRSKRKKCVWSTANIVDQQHHHHFYTHIYIFLNIYIEIWCQSVVDLSSSFSYFNINNNTKRRKRRRRTCLTWVDILFLN